MRVVFASFAMTALCGCQVVPLQDAYDQAPPARIAGIDFESSTNVRLQVEFAVPVRASVQVSDLRNGAIRRCPWRDVTSAVETVSNWTDIGEPAIRIPDVRYYRLRVQTGDGVWVSPEEWAVFFQPREPNQRYLVSIPVELGKENRLDGLLGRQLAIGMHPGQSTNEADALQYFTDEGMWRQLYLLSGAAAEPQWIDPDTGAPSTRAIPPGRAFWLIRRSGPGYRLSHGLFWGPTYRAPHAVTIRASVGEGTPFGLPSSYPRHHHRQVPADWQGGVYDPLGFAALGSGGTTSDHRQTTEVGDQIWVWKDNEWQGYYWLIGHKGPAWDGRWWDNHTRDFAEFALEPGQGYYYRHRPNRWGGTDFVWTPPLELENIDSE